MANSTVIDSILFPPFELLAHVSKVQRMNGEEQNEEDYRSGEPDRKNGALGLEAIWCKQCDEKWYSKSKAGVHVYEIKCINYPVDDCGEVY